MAGRGTDISLAKGVEALGGLHVIATELHESRRIDRQLFGRCGRQGDPGFFEAIVSLEDELSRVYLRRRRWGRSRGISSATAAASRRRCCGASSATRRRAPKRSHAAIRRELLAMDEQLGDLLAFSGEGE